MSISPVILKALRGYLVAFTSVGVLYAQSTEVIKTRQAHTLEERATRDGAVHDSVVIPDSPLAHNRLKDLAGDSNVVVVVDVDKSKCELNDGAIYTRYQGSVKEVLKRSAAPTDMSEKDWRNITSSPLMVLLPGGKVSFPNGTTAQVDALNVLPLSRQSRYLLFLHWNKRLHGFLPVGNSKGIFELSEDSEHLHWKRVTRTDKGFALESGNFAGGTLSEARDLAK